MNIKKLLSLLLIFTVLQLSAQRNEEPAFIRDSLDNYVNRALKNWEVPGAAICIVKDDKVVLMKGYGLKEINGNENVDENTLFMIGSNTKAFTGTALADLAYKNKCSLDDKVQKWMPEFKMKDKWVTNNANLIDIVSHRLGMKTFQGDFMYWGSDLSTKEVIEKFGKLTPKYEFRTKWGYCNAGFTIAGECIKNISGISWCDYLKTNIFEPLEMTNTYCFSKDMPELKNKTRGHTYHKRNIIKIEYPKIDNLAPAASISSSVNDMSNWLIAQLNDGKFDGKEVISPKVIETTRIPRSIVGRQRHPFNISHYNLYAMGWGMEDYEGYEIVSHTGGIDGYVTSVTLLPEKDLGIVVLTNTDHNLIFEAIKWEIIDSYLELPYRNYNRIYLNYYTMKTRAEEKQIALKEDTAAKNPAPALNFEEYTGDYKNDVYGNVNIKESQDGLEMTFDHHSELIAYLKPLGENRFLCSFNVPLYGTHVYKFETKNNKVKQFTFKVADFLEYTTYDFIKL